MQVTLPYKLSYEQTLGKSAAIRHNCHSTGFSEGRHTRWTFEPRNRGRKPMNRNSKPSQVPFFCTTGQPEDLAPLPKFPPRFIRRFTRHEADYG